MSADSFFVRRARSLFRQPLLRPVVSPVRLCPLHLESRDVPAITGLVYQDYNANGNFDTAGAINNDDPTAGGTIRTAIDVGLAGVTVSAFDVAGAKVATTTTKADGTYSLGTAAGNYRVEFTGLPTGLLAGPHGPTNLTSVQFVADGSANVTAAAIRPGDYFRTNPNLLTSRYIVGDQTGALDNTVANNPILGAGQPTQPVILSFPYSAGTTNQNDSPGGRAPNVNDISIPANQVGTTWGLGYDRGRNRIFAASYTKRHTGWGPGGAGAIYVFNNTSAANPTVNSATEWANIGTATALGGTFAGFRSNYTKNDDYATDSGNTGWNAVGKTGFGGLDVSEDGTKLFVMSLADKRLYVFPINADGSAGTPQSFAVPVPANATGGGADIQPFAVQVYRGLVYIGMVNSAETTQVRSDLRAYVYTFDPNTNTYSARSVLNESAAVDGVSLDYDKRNSYAGADRYRPWSPTYRRVNPDGSESAPPALNAGSNSNPSKYPQPMLSGIAFDAAGNMTLGIRDRGGDQTGRIIPSQTAATGGPGGVEGISSGDILKTFLNTPGSLAGGWALEAGGVGSGPVNNQGPGGGEFFSEDGYEGAGAAGTNSQDGANDGGHRDVTVGGIVQVPGFPDVVSTTFDPLRQTEVRSGGIRWFDSETGNLDKSHLVYGTDQGGNTFGKASGLGDLIAVNPDPVPFDIGNRVFSDTDRDGIQDPGEPTIGGVTVELWTAGPDNVFGSGGDDIAISTVKTAADGTYYFSNGPGTDSANEAFNLSKLARTVVVGGVTQLARFQIRFPDLVGADPLDGLIPTAATNDPSANGTARDSDVTTVAGVGRLIGGATGFTMATVGASDHTLDAGFVQGLFLGDFVFVDANNSGNFDAGDTAKDGITVRLYQAGNLAVAVQQTITAGGGKYQFAGLTPGNYVVEIVSPAGFRSSSGNGTETLVGNPLTDNTDHGLEFSGSSTAGFVIRANPVTLAINGNPGKVNVAGDANLFQDFGIVQVFSLGNRVWLDANNNGTIDAADGATPGIDGVTVRLFRPTDFAANGDLLGAATAVANTVTAGGGYYRFDNLLAGNYVVVADGTGAALAGLRSSTGGAVGTLTFEPAPNAIPAVGTTDSDDNGTTAANSQVRTGVITLGPTSPLNEADLVAGANPQGTVDANADLTLDFGFYRPLSLGNRVFEDANNNGLDDAEPGVGGVTVRLFRATGTGTPVGAAVATTTTTAGGYYLFTGLGADTYTVEIDGKTLPAGSLWFSSSGTNGSLTGAFEPAANPNVSKADADDNGTTVQNDAAAYLIRSGPVTLSSGTAPTGEPATPGIADATADADSNLTADFGVWRPLSLGNLVFNDANNTGIVDNGEVGIAGVPVTLYQDNGDGTFDPATDKVVGTQNTSAGATPGYYLFTNLAAGKYFVTVQPPTGFGSSTGAGNTFEPVVGLPPDSQDHGTTAGAIIRSNLVTLAAGTAPTGEPATPGRGADPTPDANSDLTIDFGLFQSLRLGDFVFEDANNNGTFDAGDTTLDGVTVTLFDGAGTQLGTTTTANGGKYLFSGLTPGQYQVQIAPPTGYVSSTGGNTEPGIAANTDNVDHGTQTGAVVKAAVITLGAAGDTTVNPSDGGFANLTQDFGLFRPVALGNFVWEDANNDGVFNAGEAAIPGATVVLLDNGGATVGTQTTDANGNYLFTGLTAGTYTVRVTPPAGFVTSTGKNGSLTGPFEPGVTTNTDNADHGTLVGATVQSTVTLAAGGDAANPSTVTNPNDANLTQDFGFYRPLSLGDLVWEDANNDGFFNNGERPLAGVPVELLDATGAVLATATTDVNGNYLFTTLIPGNYTVRVTPPAGYISSTGVNGSPTGPFEPGVTGNLNNQDHGSTAGNVITSSVALTAAGTNPDSAGLANLNQDFGLFRPLSVGNLVFADANNDGVRNAGEAAIPGVTVQLTDATGTVIGTQTTDVNGNYLFANLVPGTYTVRVTTPTGLVSSSGTPNSLTGPFEPGVSGTQDDQDHGTAVGTFAASTVTLAAAGDPANPDNGGLANLRQDFGFTPPPVPPTLSLGNLVFRDANNNGVQDAGEPGIAGVTVALTKADGSAVGTQATDANGNYLFTGLTAGDYVVTVTPPAGSFLVSSTGKNGFATGPFEPGVSGTQDSQDHGTITGTAIASKVTLAAFGNAANPDTAGGANLRQDFGLFVPLSYGNTVFIDTNNNGKQDATEKGIAGVPVRLLDGTGAVVVTATTDANGKYQFTSLIPGSYQVEIVPPAGLNASTPVFDPLNTVDNLNIGKQSGATIKSAPFALALGAAPLISGNTNPNNFVTGDFGLQGFAQVSGFVYLDPDVNGKFTNGQNGDRPFGGVTVTLTGNGVTRTTTTDATGFYQFTGLLPGTYTITETQPGGIIYDGLDTIGSLGGTLPSNDVQTVTLVANDNGVMYNFGEIPPAAVTGYVFVDANGNCQLDLGETRLAGVPISITGTAFAGTVLARPLVSTDGTLTVLTDATGRYEFPLLPPGNYSITRGDLTAVQRTLYVDYCSQIGDPNGPDPATATVRAFGGLPVSSSTIRGPFNFAVVPPVNPNDPTKQNFLGSSGNPNGGGVTPGATGRPTRQPATAAPAFATTTGNPTQPAFVVAAAGAGYSPQVRVFDYATGIEKFKFYAYEETFTGGVRTATADVTGDGSADIVTATGVGGGPRIKVYDGKTGAVTREFFAYEPDFRGGVFVAAGDINGDGAAEIVTGTETGGGPRVTVFDGRTGAVLLDFFAFDSAQRGGVRVAVADFNNDGRADIVTTTGAGVPTRVRVYSGLDQTVLADYAPFEAAFTGGVNLSAGDFNGDGTPDIVLGAEAGGGPRVQIFSGLTQTVLANFFAYEPTFGGGVRVAARDVTGDGKADLAIAAGPGGSARVRVLRSTDLSVVDDFFAFDQEFTGGTYVG